MICNIFFPNENWHKLHVILKWHAHALQLATTSKMTLMYLLVIIHINNQFVLHKVNIILYMFQLVEGLILGNNKEEVVHNELSL